MRRKLWIYSHLLKKSLMLKLHFSCSDKYLYKLNKSWFLQSKTIYDWKDLKNLANTLPHTENPSVEKFTNTLTKIAFP